VESADGISYKALSAKHGVHEGTVKQHGRDGEWVARRKMHHDQTATKALLKTQEKLSEQAAQVAFDAQAAATKAANVALEALDDPALPFNSKDAAIRALLEALKLLEVLSGNPDTISDSTVRLKSELTHEELLRLQEGTRLLLLDDGTPNGAEPGGGGAGGGGEGEA